MKQSKVIRIGLPVALVIVAGVLLILYNLRIFVHEKSIAVLPFRDLDQEVPYKLFVQDLREQLINDLNKADDFEVIALSSNDLQILTGKTMPEMGREIHADYIVEGSISVDDSIVKVWVRLIKAKSDHSIWGKVFKGDRKRCFEFPSAMSKEIASSLDSIIFSKEHPNKFKR